jgi:flagellar biosynthesis/type III secretory pathway protein FliH
VFGEGVGVSFYNIAISLFAVAAVVALLAAIEKRGYKQGHAEGYQEGFEAGRMRADDWWMNLEYETLTTQKKIREES